jgi:oxepin-CoA hydrolase/3-oxo-5,6-dehydrosuberyl-CoA semialdehyde dehydrogenase
LFAYASLRRKLPNQSFCLDGEVAPLSKSNTFIGHHLLVPKEGVAIHINAFNFPVWGMLEKNIGELACRYASGGLNLLQ